MTQRDAFKALKSGHNIFLTGAAGSGKTFLLNRYIAYLKKKKIGVAVTASTGIAATHMDGITIHSWSGMGVKDKLRESDLKKLVRNARIRRNIKNARVLIIDEVSMLHSRQLDMVDAICRRFLDKGLPFGGLQVILCGDFFQLPPIERGKSKMAEFAYSAKSWKKGDFKICYLREQHRQKNDGLVRLLNSIRAGQAGDKEAKVLSSRIQAHIDSDIKPTRLFSHNVDVDYINNIELNKLPGNLKQYDMRSQGSDRLVAAIMHGCLAPANLILKKGAQVMFVKNNFEYEYVNGTTGIVEDFDVESKMPIVRTVNGKRIIARPETWLIEEKGEIVASIRQVPLRLAWAITIHKSQGMSLDVAEIDLAKAFEYGMGYVALSRVRTLGGMKLLGLNETALQVNPEILKKDIELQKKSDKFMKELKKK